MRIHLDQRYVIAASCVLALVLSIVLAVTAYEIVGDPLAELSQSNDDVVEGEPETEVLGAAETADEADAGASANVARGLGDGGESASAAVPVDADADEDEDEDESAGAGAVALVIVDDTATISGRVWIDLDGDGVQDAGEPGNEDVVVVLVFASTDTEAANTTTDADGNYSFNVPSETYYLYFDIEIESMSPPSQGSEDVDSDIEPGGFLGSDGGVTDTITIPLLAGEDSTRDAGIIPIRSGVSIETNTNGSDSDELPGQELEVGSTATFTYEVTNIGNVRLTAIVVEDEVIGTIGCPRNELGLGESVTCTATANVTEGPYVAAGSVVATPIDSIGDALPVAAAEDLSHHVGVIPFEASASISLVTTTNGADDNTSPGTQLTIGSDVAFGFAVTNTGKTDLVDVDVSDTILGDVCSFMILAVGETKNCPDVTSVVTDGIYRSAGTATAVPIDQDGNPFDSLVSSSDPTFHVGVSAPAACTTNLTGPRMLAGGVVVDETGYVAEAGSTIRIVTSEPGASPDQPYEQVFVTVGTDLYGPTPVELGAFEFVVENTGPVVILHYSEVTGDTSRANSVEYEWCGTDLSVQKFYQCPAVVDGPRMQRNNSGVVEWDSGLIAAPGSTIEITTSEPGASPGQPNEQIYVFVGEEQFGPTPNEHTTTTIVVGDGGPVIVKHYSVLNETSFDSNSVEFSLCGSDLTKVG